MTIVANSQAKDDCRASKRYTSRRNVLRSSAVLAGVGLAGCSGILGDEEEDTLKVGAPLPFSGAFSPTGEALERTIQLAVDKANEQGDAGDFDVEVQFGDTQTEPAEGLRVAEEMMDDGVDILVGTVATPVESAILDMTRGEDVLTLTNSATRRYYLEDCYEHHFSISANTFNQASSTLGPALDMNLGDDVYTIAGAFDWGQNHYDAVTEHVIPERGGTHIGNTWTDLGQGDYSHAWTEAMEADPDIVYAVLFGTDLVQGINQALEFGVMDEGISVVVPFSGMDLGRAMNPDAFAHENLYQGLQWYWEVETPDTNEFVQEYRDEFQEVPIAFEGLVYGSYRTVFNIVGEQNSKDVNVMREGLVDRPLDKQLWDVGEHFRACNQALMYPPLLAQGRPESDWNEDQSNIFEIMNIVTDLSTIYRDCDETGCELPPV